MTPGIRLGIRTRLLLAVVGTLAFALIIGVTAFNLILEQRLSASAESLARAQAQAELSSLKVENGKLVAPAGLEERGAVGSTLWVFAGGTIIEKPLVPRRWTKAAASLAGGPEGTDRVRESVRLYALPVIYDGNRVGTVVAGVSLDPYEETATIALVGSIALAVAFLAAVALLTHWILGKAFLPVSRMTKDAAAWSDHDLDKRFDQGEPYDELTRLAATLDAMLERLSASLRHEQRFTAELSHELRTPLAKITAEGELALRRERTNATYRESLAAILRNAEQMTRTVEALIVAARQEIGPARVTTDARAGVQLAVAGIRDEAERNGIGVLMTLPADEARVAVESDLVERIVHPLLDNALRYGRSEVSVGLVPDGTTVTITVSDNGAGIATDETDRIFEPGVRGSAGAHDQRGAGLGLALARRLARSAGGEIVAHAATTGGRFTVRLPTA